MTNELVSMGKFILIEGPDTAGKSTQAKLLQEALEAKGIKVVLMHFPDYDSPFGEMIGTYLKQNLDSNSVEHFLAMQMVYIADQLAAQAKIMDYLTDNVWVIADRYHLSTRVYTYARLQQENTSVLVGMYQSLRGSNCMKTIAQMQSLLEKPDHSFILDLPYQEIRKRKGVLDGFESDDLFMKSVAEGYRLAYEESEKENVQLIDATLSIEEVHEIILKEVSN